METIIISREKWNRITELIGCLKKVFAEATTPGMESGEFALIGDHLWEKLEAEIANLEK